MQALRRPDPIKQPYQATIKQLRMRAPPVFVGSTSSSGA
jgi:hypothetical protein